jgi:hypothetical protein
MWKSTFFMDFHNFPLSNRPLFQINIVNTTGPKFKYANLTFFMHQSTFPFFGIWGSPSLLYILIDFLYLHSLPGILHPACACHPQQHRQKSHFTPQLHSLPSITSNLFSSTITIMPSTKHITQQKIQQYMPHSHQVLCLACQESCLTPQLLWQYLSKNDSCHTL